MRNPVGKMSLVALICLMLLLSLGCFDSPPPKSQRSMAKEHGNAVHFLPYTYTEDFGGMLPARQGAGFAVLYEDGTIEIIKAPTHVHTQ